MLSTVISAGRGSRFSFSHLCAKVESIRICFRLARRERWLGSGGGFESELVVYPLAWSAKCVRVRSEQ